MASDYLESHYGAPMPGWMSDFDPQSLELPRKVLANLLGSRHVFYPGSGSDGSPVALFNSAQAAACFVYVDLMLEQDTLLHELSQNGFRGYHTLTRIELEEADFGIGHWKPHLTSAEMKQAPKPVPPYGFIEILEKEAGSNVPGYFRIAILFLRADGPAAYDALYCQGEKSSPAPLGIVIQDHGFAGIWSPFGKGGAMHTIANRANVLPRILLVSNNSEAWDGYGAVEGINAHEGPRPRKIYERIS